MLASYVHHATSSTPGPIRATTSSSLGHISLLKRLAAVLVGAFPVRAPSAMSSLGTGGCVLGTTARSRGREFGPSLTMPKEPGIEIADTPRVGIKQFFPSPTSKHAAFSCEIEPPEAHTAALDLDIFADPEPPEAYAGSPRRDRRRWRGPPPRPSRPVCTDGRITSFRGRARSLGEGCRMGRVPLTLSLVSRFCLRRAAGGERGHPRGRMRRRWGTPTLAQAKDAVGVGYPLSPSLRIADFLRTPDRQRHARAPSVKGGGALTPTARLGEGVGRLPSSKRLFARLTTRAVVLDTDLSGW
ncbi:hypothetical protein EV121DRAFT_274100 [Schizophyllum commune]